MAQAMRRGLALPEVTDGPVQRLVAGGTTAWNSTVSSR